MSEKELDIYELIELSHVPEVKDILALKLNEMKASQTRQFIENYREKKAFHRRTLFDDIVRQDKESSLHWFVMTRFRYFTWHITEIVPEPPSYMPMKNFLPHDIIEEILDSPVDPDKVHSPETVYSANARSFFDLRYVRYSTNNLFGTIRENIARKDEMYRKVNIPTENKRETALNVLFECIDNHPGVAKMFIDGMLDIVIPYLAAEARLKEINEAMAKTGKKKKKRNDSKIGRRFKKIHRNFLR